MDGITQIFHNNGGDIKCSGWVGPCPGTRYANSFSPCASGALNLVPVNHHVYSNWVDVAAGEGRFPGGITSSVARSESTKKAPVVSRYMPEDSTSKYRLLSRAFERN